MSKSRYALGKVICLGSSSEGNSYYVEINRKDYQVPYTLIIECGFNYQELTKRMVKKGLSMRNVNAVLVSHKHHDHSVAVPKLVENGIKVFAPKSVFEYYNVLDQVTKQQIMKDGSKKRIADEIDVIGVGLEHKDPDGSPVENLGYIIQANCDYGLHTIFFATDTYYIKYDLSSFRFNTIFLEANNFRRNIIFSLKKAQENGNRFQEQHYDRVLHSHMLVENTIKTLVGTDKRNGFDLSETDMIYLIHLSASGNVNPQEIKTKIQNSLKQKRLTRLVKRNDKDYISPKVFVFRKNGEIV